ncbi:MAG: NAD(P)/FAD-dependent oxidoreductase [Bacteroidales bacterium]|nr:NAD(P)/FAD-dependent oxidoreductase [Bacteroidales bacterium]
MPHILDIDLTPEQYHVKEQLHHVVARRLGVSVEQLSAVRVVRRSLDSRRGIRYHAQLQVFMQNEPVTQADYSGHYQDCCHADPVVIVGAGPAGLFAALHALEVGLRPIIVDRGKPVERRRRDLAPITQQGVVNPNSNWCFGEGGAGTYSDGKLYTRSTKRGNVQQVLARFVEHGADAEIMVDAHAHIGTDRLSGIISNMRATIERYGGEYHFDSRVVDLVLKQGRAVGVRTATGENYEGVAVVLATGHSARDIYELFDHHGWLLEAKPFALGVRVEHPQALINSIQYHSDHFSPSLPAAAYSLTTQVDGHGVFSFCMCPGGVIVPAATDSGQQVVNGMSNSRRNSPFANSGIAVTVAPDDVPEYGKYGALALMHFQQDVERRTFHLAGDSVRAPIQRLTDFCEGRQCVARNDSGYMGSVVSAPLEEALPPFVTHCLRQGFRDFGRKMRGFYTAQASVLAVESRTSSPVRIPRGDDMQHPQLPGLFPCGEGAGYAGGIVSSAIDGINCIDALWHSRG